MFKEGLIQDTADVVDCRTQDHRYDGKDQEFENGAVAVPAARAIPADVPLQYPVVHEHNGDQEQKTGQGTHTGPQGAARSSVDGTAASR